jgi:hypothetical protein
MRKILIIIILFSFGCVKRIPEPTLYRKEWKKAEIKIEKPIPKLKIGEKLNYNVRWLGINVGTVNCEVMDIEEFMGYKAYHIKVIAETNRFLSRLFKVKDEFHSYLTVDGLKPLCYKSKRRERRYREESITTFDYKKGEVKFHSLRENSLKVTKLEKGQMDIIGGLYKFRTMDFDNKNHIKLNIAHRARNWIVDIKFLKKGILELRKHGVLPVFLVELKAHSGKEVARGRAWVWFSADEKRKPLLVQIHVRIPIIGNIVVALD